MKIGLFGNTNNSMFILAEALRTLGHQVVLVVTSKELLNRPESRAPELTLGYPDWVVDASALDDEDYFVLSPGVAPIVERLSSCDALLLNFVGPSLLPLLNRPAIAFLTGSDLDYYANPSMIEARTKAASPAHMASPAGQQYVRTLTHFVQRQRQGIRSAVAVRYFPRGLVPDGDRLLDEIGVEDANRLPLIAVDPSVKMVPAPHNQPIRVFCATRLTWKLPVELGRSTLDYKGSDVMVRGLGAFYRATGTRLDIQLVRKGLHVEDLKVLIDEEGLADQVTWSDEMSLTEVWDRFAKSDIVIEQLSDSVVAGAGLDAMATGRPVIGNAHPEMYEARDGEMAPFCLAKTAEEVSAHLQRLVFDPGERERIGRAGGRYVEEHFSIWRAIQICLERFETALNPVAGRVKARSPLSGLS